MLVGRFRREVEAEQPIELNRPAQVGDGNADCVQIGDVRTLQASAERLVR
jgi:hypothetical protein